MFFPSIPSCSTGDFRFFSRIFPSIGLYSLQKQRLYAETRDLTVFQMQLSRSVFILLYSSRFFLKRFPLFDWMQRCRGKFYNVSKSDTVPKAPIQLFSSFICFLLQRLSPRSDPFVAVHRNEKQTFMQFRNGCLDSEKEMEFLCRPAETTCTVEWGGNLENGNSVSFDFFQRGRYRVSAKGIVDSRNCLDGG